MSNLHQLLRQSMQELEAVVLDAATIEKDTKPTKGRGETYIEQSIQVEALALLKDWADMSDGDLDEGETYGERLHSLLVVMADEDGDEKITADEEITINAAKDAIAQYLDGLGTDENDVRALLDDQDEDAAEAIRAMVSDDDLDPDDIVFGEEDGEVMDAAVPVRSEGGAVRKKFVSFHHGVKTIRWKRVAGRPKKPTQAQKTQRMKALAKTKTSNAMRRWKKSMTNRAKSGIKPKTPA